MTEPRLPRDKVRWEEMFRDELLAAQAECPVVYLPYGLCEPHGPQNALGLDAIKAHELCVRAARTHGGVVAPPFFWQIHETGYHAPWADVWIGRENPFMTSVPPWVFLRLFLYQLRAVAARGFRAALVVTGHYGGNERDLRLVAEALTRRSPLRVWAGADWEMITHPKYRGDHAGATETSQLWFLRPDLVDITRLTPEESARHFFAAGGDALDSSRRLGQEIVEGQVASLGAKARELLAAYEGDRAPVTLSYDETEEIWREILGRRDEWVTLKLHPGQASAPEGSPWRANERPRWADEPLER